MITCENAGPVSGNEFMTTEINDEATLKSVAGILHDARFTADEIGFDKLKHTFSLKCWILEPKRNEQTTSWKAYRLSFTNVTACQINIKEKVPYYEISTLRFTLLK